MIEFINFSSKQIAAKMAPSPAASPATKDYVSTQLEAVDQAMRSLLGPRQQFECLYKMNSVLYRHPSFPALTSKIMGLLWMVVLTNKGNQDLW